MPSFNSKDELNLKMHIAQAQARINISQNTKRNLVSQETNAIVGLLKAGKSIQLPRIKQEQIIREEFLMEANEILRGYLELITARLHLVTSEPACPESIREAVCTVIWASKESEIKEFAVIKEDFMKKYGKKFVKSVLENKDGFVDPYVISKLQAKIPDMSLVMHSLRTLAAERQIDISAIIPDEQLPDIASDPQPIHAPDFATVNPGTHSYNVEPAYDPRQAPPQSTVDPCPFGQPQQQQYYAAAQGMYPSGQAAQTWQPQAPPQHYSQPQDLAPSNPPPMPPSEPAQPPPPSPKPEPQPEVRPEPEEPMFPNVNSGSGQPSPLQPPAGNVFGQSGQRSPFSSVEQSLEARFAALNTLRGNNDE
ncbi:Regulator of Vps4 activity in the MVB pathway [Carpediemonas membranifera]|uniref:Regulator of Vps4 activity in the MVB pathway n=1 Tax=Carpediemonas membranifera TaxID=201153 RepID=A0A8J6AQM9_9EUKA|nr:Regulator of Vps4 activity in the MVB pathway [Carpediemonas membranifera]QNO39419.1 increased sodium tolerance 1 [Carpediemonas membranifera]|eukprot:KAG9391651.1 Regulator of Vps4 activity in the MVB pathway [Carpediemonas membranifera]